MHARRFVTIAVITMLFVASVPVALGIQTAEVVDGRIISSENIDTAVHEVLSRSRYVGERAGLFDFLTDTPVTRFLADRWQRFVEWLNSFFQDSAPNSPGEASRQDPGRSSFGVPLLLGIALIAGLLAARITRRRVRGEEFEFATDPHAQLNTEQLSTEADRAASDGDHELSVRLRFKSGLLTLDRRGIIEYDEAQPLGTVREKVSEPGFDAVADGFERVTYSNHEASTSDSEASKSGWHRVLNRIRSSDDG